MCGIAGILRFDPALVRAGEVERMTAALAHRGPDDQGVYGRDGVALGHRRLSIIDLAAGHQPMANEDQQAWIVFNGEIYNFQELRPQLEAHGHRFATHSDTEVILHAWEQWGESCVEHLRGMFAFAIADFCRRKLFLARDHLGIKPLCYRVGKGYFAWASELNALREVEDRTPAGDVQAVEFFLRQKYIPQPHTIYRDVYKLAPGHRLTVDFSGKADPPQRYWQMQFHPDESSTLSDDDWLSGFEQVVRQSVQAHLVADVPFGVFLSGGIDSTLVAMLMSELLATPVKAFSIGFEEAEFSELKYAEQAAQALGLEHHCQVVRADVADVLPRLLHRYGEPFADSSAVPTWHVCRMAREQVPMVLSGDGGDEGFAGYGRYDVWMRHGPLQYAAAALLSPRSLGDELALLAMSLTRSAEVRRTLWEHRLSSIPPALRRRLWRAELRHLTTVPMPAFVHAGHVAEGSDPLAYAQLIDIETYLPGDILTKVDIAAMDHGLEVRTPLVDREVMAWAARVPMRLRRRVSAGQAELKVLPKRALGRRFPKAFIHRPKMGFGIPQQRWLQPASPLRPLLEDVLLSPRAKIHELLNAKAVRGQVLRNDAGRGDSYALWTLLALGVWLEQHRDVSFD